jgi:tRNA(adenine34) deaminase
MILAYMQQTLELATKAAQLGEVPVGAIVVHDNKIIGVGYNQKEASQCVTRHAEIIAIEQACKALGSWRLPGCILYVSLEPCLMCAGAIYQARIEQVFYGAKDPKFGALGSLYTINSDTRLNHRFEVSPGHMEEECAQILKDFFKKKR